MPRTIVCSGGGCCYVGERQRNAVDDIERGGACRIGPEYDQARAAVKLQINNAAAGFNVENDRLDGPVARRQRTPYDADTVRSVSLRDKAACVFDASNGSRACACCAAYDDGRHRREHACRRNSLRHAVQKRLQTRPQAAGVSVYVCEGAVLVCEAVEGSGAHAALEKCRDHGRVVAWQFHHIWCSSAVIVEAAARRCGKSRGRVSAGTHETDERGRTCKHAPFLAALHPEKGVPEASRVVAAVTHGARDGRHRALCNIDASEGRRGIQAQRQHPLAARGKPRELASQKDQLCERGLGFLEKKCVSRLECQVQRLGKALQICSTERHRQKLIGHGAVG